VAELEERINSALDADTMPSGDLEVLLAEVEGAVADARAEAKQSHAQARDIACTDYTAAHARAVAAELTVDRLQGVVPDLQAKRRQATAQEYRERWLADFRHVEAKRDLAAGAFARYPEIVAELITIFQQAEAADKEVQRVNAAAPGSQRLQTVELHARKLERFTRATPSLAKTVQLPDYQESEKLLWPPRVPRDMSLFAPVIAPAAGPDWYKYADARVAERQADAERVANYNAERERTRKEREKVAR
jgi:hypothetical protein